LLQFCAVTWATKLDTSFQICPEILNRVEIRRVGRKINTIDAVAV
jgi:hypothetical protein